MIDDNPWRNAGDKTILPWFEKIILLMHNHCTQGMSSSNVKEVEHIHSTRPLLRRCLRRWNCIWVGSRLQHQLQHHIRIFAAPRWCVPGHRHQTEQLWAVVVAPFGWAVVVCEWYTQIGWLVRCHMPRPSHGTSFLDSWRSWMECTWVALFKQPCRNQTD